jgi:hypothetical protein
MKLPVLEEIPMVKTTPHDQALEELPQLVQRITEAIAEIGVES